LRTGALPASAFAEDFNDAGEALATVVPVGLERALNAIGVTVGEGADDFVVFGDGKLQVADDRAGIKTPVALCLGLDGSVPCAEARARAGNGESMEVAIDLEDAALFAVVAFDIDELLVEGFELLDDLRSFGLRKGGSASSGQTFEASDDRVKLGGVLFCERGDDHAALVRHTVFANVTFLLELVEGGAYGSATDVETAGKVSFDDPGSRGEFSMHDELAELVERSADAGAVDQFGWAGLRVIFGSSSGHRRDFRFRLQLILDCTITNCGVAMWDRSGRGF